MKNIKKILKEIVEKCSGELDLEGIIQFGSSTYSKDFHDIDLVFFFKEEVLPTKKILKLIEMIKDFEEKYNELVFDFGSSGTRKREAKYSITIVCDGKKDLEVENNPHDLFLLKNLADDKDMKLLFGRNPLRYKKMTFTNQHLFEMLAVDQKHALRRSLDDKKYKLESSYFLFKTFIRAMLINERDIRKSELLSKFKKKYSNKIKLPKNSEKIINCELKEGDFKDILKFTEDCLRWLVK